MASRVRRMCGDALVSAAVVAVVIGVLVSVDVRLREQLGAAVRAASADTVADAGGQVRAIGFALFDAARTQSVEHAPLMIFALVATVLLLALARS